MKYIVDPITPKPLVENLHGWLMASYGWLAVNLHGWLWLRRLTAAYRLPKIYLQLLLLVGCSPQELNQRRLVDNI